MADTIYFDISDLLLFAMKNNRVSGIQRVIIRVLAAYQRYSTETQVRFITFHPILNQVVEVDSSWLRKLEEFESDEMKSYFYLTDKIALSNSKRPIEFFRDVFHFYKIKLGILKSRLGLRLKAKDANCQTDQKHVNFYWPNIALGDKLVLLGAFWGLPKTIQFFEKQSRANIPIFIMVHDTIPILQHRTVEDGVTNIFRRDLGRFSKIATTFLVNSLSTAKDLKAALYDLGTQASPNIVVTPLAQQFTCNNSTDFLNAHTTRDTNYARPYVLCVGTIEPRKNATALLSVWLQLHKTLGLATPRLIFAGKRGWSRDGFEAILNATGSIFGAVTVVEDATDEELKQLYQNCLFTIFPSFYEGWGLPVGESLWFGKTCITSNTSSLPEVGQDMVIYIDPHDLFDIYEKTLDLIRHPAKRIKLEKLIKSRKLRTWDDVGKDIYKALHHRGI